MALIARLLMSFCDEVFDFLTVFDLLTVFSLSTVLGLFTVLAFLTVRVFLDLDRFALVPRDLVRLLVLTVLRPFDLSKVNIQN